MRTSIRVLFALALAAFAGAAAADPPGRVGRLNYVSGAVSLAAAEEPDQWTQAVLNRPLTGGDRLWVDRDARSELHVGSTAVRLAPLTSLDILHLDDDRIQLRLAQGTANIRVRELDADDVVEIATPSGAVLVRQPGSYRVSADPQTDDVRVVVNFGEAEVVTPDRSFLVPSGQAGVLTPDAPPAYEVAHASTDEFDRWSAERDRREDRVASTRYVSPHMTGYEDLDQHGSWRNEPDYGAVWIPARVAPDWAPYRHGHWTWVSPWGWTWVDDAPWGFAPSHYGRWVRVHDRWAWAPGPLVRRPVYAPALVAFVGGSSWSVSVHSGPSVGWFPLGWREPYRPWYRASNAHVHRVNATHVTNVTHIYNTRVTHVHRHRPDAVTVVPRQAFVGARPVSRARFNVAQSELARAEVLRDRAPAERVRADVAPERRGQRPPARAAAREVVVAPANAGETRSRERQARTNDRREQRAFTAVEPSARVQQRPAPAEEQRERSERGRDPAPPARAEQQAQRAEQMRQRAEAQRQGAAAAQQQRAEAARERTQAQRAAPPRTEPPQRAQPQRERAEPRREQQERAERRREPGPRSAAPQQADRARWNRDAAPQRGQAAPPSEARATRREAAREAPAARQAPARAMQPAVAQPAAAPAARPAPRAQQSRQEAPARAQRREERQGERARPGARS